MIINFNNSIKIILSISIFLISIILSPYYTEGDQIHYINAYNGLTGLSITDGFRYYALTLSSFELVHFYLSWIFVNIQIDKEYFVAFSNTFLVYSLITLLQRMKVATLIISIIVLSNFYIVMLYFTAERLKYAVAFLFLAMSYSGKKKFLVVFLSIISHVQIIVIFISILFKDFLKSFMRFIKSYKMSKSFLITSLVFLIPLLIMNEQILRKATHPNYINDNGILELGKSFIFLIMAYYYSRNKSETIYIYIPILIAIYIVGGERLNMMSYFLFMYYALQVNRGFNVGVILTSTYFSYQSFVFIYNIITYGNGFYKQ